MIFDSIYNLKNYQSIPRIDAIVDFLQKNDPLSVKEGETEIQSRDLFVIASKYVPQKAEEKDFEIHKKYIDVQLILEGIEEIHLAHLEDLEPKTEYVEKRDFQFFTTQEDPSRIVVRADEFIVFPIGEPHRPGCLYQGCDEPVRKLVFKTKF